MSEVNLSINGRSYAISCDDGQERRVNQLGQYIDSRLKEISKAGAASNELHLLVLTSLMIADETLELREEVTRLTRQVAQAGNGHDMPDDAAISHAIDQLASRIDSIAGRMQKA